MGKKELLNQVSNIKNLIIKDNHTHVWEFSRIGGVNRVNISKGLDIVHLKNLDQKLWTSLSCPVHGLEVDSKTLELIDIDHDGRVRVPEIIAAANWITSVIKNPDELISRNKNLQLSSINDETEEGKQLLSSAKQILINLGKENQTEISVEETSDLNKIFENTAFNGDGIIIEESANEPDLKNLIHNIIDLSGSVIDRSGKPGINEEIINNFYQACEDFSAWNQKAESDEKKYLPFGNSTPDAYTSFNQVRSKIDDYFLRCRLSEFDSISAEALNPPLTLYEIISPLNLNEDLNEIASLPLAKINNKKVLPLKDTVNPSWEKALNHFTQIVVAPMLKKEDFISADDWSKISHVFDDYSRWMAEKEGATVEKIGLTAVREILENSKKAELLALIEKDRLLTTETENILKVDKLTRYYRDFYTIIKNFVNFSDFYSPESFSAFQAGKLYIDQRCCDLCIKVSDMPKHNFMAGNSGICLVYCDCVNKSKNEKITIVAALTDGDIDNITLGRNAIFYDTKGNDWDATIIKIIDNPISIKQAFWSPYKKISKFFSKQIEKLAASKEAEVNTAVSSNIEKTTAKVDSTITESVKSKPEPAVTLVPVPPQAPPQPFDIGKFAGIFAAFSLAIGAIGSVVISALAGFFKLQWWQMPIALIGIILCISGPSMILAFLKLRKRNLAPVLDANGWAINAKLTINIIFGKTLTHLAKLPENSKINLTDPFTKKKKPAIPIIIITLIILITGFYLLWHFGYISRLGFWK